MNKLNAIRRIIVDLASLGEHMLPKVLINNDFCVAQ